MQGLNVKLSYIFKLIHKIHIHKVHTVNYLYICALLFTYLQVQIVTPAARKTVLILLLGVLPHYS